MKIGRKKYHTQILIFKESKEKYYITREGLNRDINRFKNINVLITFDVLYGVGDYRVINL